MKKNMGGLDRGIRIVFVLAVVTLYATDVISGTIAIILGVLAVAMMVTSVVGLCPIYIPFGLSTTRKSGSRGPGAPTS